MPKASDRSSDRNRIVKFASDVAFQSWIGAHVKREFPRLICGVIWSNEAGNFEFKALPNSSNSPFKAWEVDPVSLIDHLRMLKSLGYLHIGTFSSWPPGKFPTAEGITAYYPEAFTLVVSTTPSGHPAAYGVYEVGADGTHIPVIAASTEWGIGQESFSDQTRVISTCIQLANRELMEWLRKHPNDLTKVHPGTFELIIAELFRDQGYDVHVMGSWNEADGGIDILAVRKDTLAGDFRVGVQCKRYVKTQKVKADLVWALNARLDKFHLHKGVIATTAKFENSVLTDLEQHLWRIELRDFNKLKIDLEMWGQFEQGGSGLWLSR